MTPERMRQIEMFLSGNSAGLGPGGSGPFPTQQEIDTYLRARSYPEPGGGPMSGADMIASGPAQPIQPRSGGGGAPRAGGTTFSSPTMGGGGGNRMIESVTPAAPPRPRSAMSMQMEAQHQAFMQQMADYLGGRMGGGPGGTPAPFPRMRQGGPPMMPGQPSAGPSFPFNGMPPGMNLPPMSGGNVAPPRASMGRSGGPLQMAEQRYLSSLARPDAYGNMDMDYGNDYLADVFRIDPARAQQLASQGQRIASNYASGQSYTPPSTSSRPMQSSFPSRSMPRPMPSSVLPADFPF